jgi:sporulation protein YlmC with PRC-barrel domain
MQNDVQIADTSDLSYLEATKVSSPAGVLSELDVVNAEGHRLGNIEGVVIDAAARCVRYLCVRSSGWFGRQYLLHADQLGQIDGERKSLRLRADLEQEAVHGLDAAGLRRFSDDDVLAAMFPRVAA